MSCHWVCIYIYIYIYIYIKKHYIYLLCLNQENAQYFFSIFGEAFVKHNEIPIVNKWLTLLYTIYYITIYMYIYIYIYIYILYIYIYIFIFYIYIYIYTAFPK